VVIQIGELQLLDLAEPHSRVKSDQRKPALELWLIAERRNDLKRLGMPLVIMSGNPDMIVFAVEHGLQMVGKPFKASQLRAATEWAVIPQHKSRARLDVHHR
jgi:hypothetical protein